MDVLVGVVVVGVVVFGVVWKYKPEWLEHVKNLINKK
jgi:hypothetical protein|tara:strand:- start:803 stop:913 length:111 start_codon:yes stop_codon:yes gene_type:complete